MVEYDNLCMLRLGMDRLGQTRFYKSQA